MAYPERAFSDLLKTRSKCGKEDDMSASSLDDNDAKDLLLDGISQAVKELQREHLVQETFKIANENVQLQRLCQHIDQVFLCGLYRREQGYWRLVNKMTRQEALHLLDHLPSVKTSLGKGRAWLYLSLNENVLESYLRALPNYEELISGMYSKDSFMRDSERMFTLTTLITGLDFLCFELTVDIDYFDRHGLLPAATNCGLSFNYTSSSVEATTTFRAVHSPLREKPDPLAAGSGNRWDFRGIRGYLSKQADKLTAGGSAPRDIAASSPPAEDSTLTQSLSSSISSLKVMASRWTGSHETGLSRPDYKEIAAIVPGEGPPPLQEHEQQPGEGDTLQEHSALGPSPDSSAAISDSSAERISPGGTSTAQRLLSTTSNLAQQMDESTQLPSGQDVISSESQLHTDGGTPAGVSSAYIPHPVGRTHTIADMQDDALERSSRSKSFSGGATSGQATNGVLKNGAAASATSNSVTWAASSSSKRSTTGGGGEHSFTASLPLSGGGFEQPESDLVHSTEGSFNSSGTFKTKPSTRRLDFGGDYVGASGPPSIGSDRSDYVDGPNGDDDVEVIQLSKKTKKGKKKKKPNVAVIASPKRIAEEEEGASGASGQRDVVDGGGSYRGMFASRLVEQQRQQMLNRDSLPEGRPSTSASSEAAQVTVAATTEHSDRPVSTSSSSGGIGGISSSVSSSISNAVSTAPSPTTAIADQIDSDSEVPTRRLTHTGATPSHVRFQPPADTRVASPELPAPPEQPSLQASTDHRAPGMTSSMTSSASAVTSTVVTSAAVVITSSTEEAAAARPATPVRSIYDSFVSGAVTSSPMADVDTDTAGRAASASAPEPVPVAQLVNDDEADVILSPSQSSKARANTSSFSFGDYNEYDFGSASAGQSGQLKNSSSVSAAPTSHADSEKPISADSPQPSSESKLLESRPSETVAVETRSADTGTGDEKAMSSRSPVAENSLARPASTRSNLSGQSTHSRTSFTGGGGGGGGDYQHGRSSNPSPGSVLRSVSTTSSSDMDPASSRRLRSSSRGGEASPSLHRRVSKTSTPSVVADVDGEKIEVVELGAVAATSSADDSDMLPTLQRSKEALLEERNYPIPERPSLSDANADQHDLSVDHNLQLMLSLKIFKVSSNESLVKLMRVQTSAGRGKFKVTIAVLSNFAFYLMSMDGTEGKYHRELCFPYRNFDHIEISLSWQTITLVCRNEDQQTLVTANEAVTRGLVKSLIRAAQSSGAQAPRVDARDRERLQLLEQHIEGLDNEDATDSEFTLVQQPEAEFRVLRYSVVHWEQLDGKESQSLFATSTAVVMEGPIHYKQTMVGISYWTEGYAVLKNGTFFLYGREDAEEPSVFIQLWGTHCGGCRRLNVPDRQNCFEVKSTSDSLTLSVEKEEDVMAWLQAICEVVAGTMGNTAQAQCVQCSLVVTPTKLYCYQEDFWGGPLFLLSACDVNEVTTVFVDEQVRTYCTVAFGLTFESGSWLLCFDSEYELGQFETALSTAWKDLFKIPLTFAPIGEGPARERARDAVALVESRFNRSDSVTRGRT